MSEFIKN